MLPRLEPNGHGAPNGAELAQRTYTRATDSSAATDRYAAMWGSSNPTAGSVNFSSLRERTNALMSLCDQRSIVEELHRSDSQSGSFRNPLTSTLQWDPAWGAPPQMSRHIAWGASAPPLRVPTDLYGE